MTFSWGLDGNLPKRSNLISLKEKQNRVARREQSRTPGMRQGVIQIKKKEERLEDFVSLITN